MAQQKKYYTAEEAAEVLGVTPGEVSQRRERHELHGLRDGATWKFKVDDIEALAKQLKEGQTAPADQGDVLASEVELGPSASSKSGTVLGPGKPASDSDIKLGGSDVKLGGSDIRLAGSDVKLGGSDPKLGSSDIRLADTDAAEPAPAAGESAVEELDMTLDEDLKLDDSQIAPADEEDSSAAVAPVPPAAQPGKKAGDSGVRAGAKPLEDDEMVLGGEEAGAKKKGSGSDVTIGSDSGINLVDPADSGLSLEEPVELAASDDDSLELGEDDMLTFEGADTESPTELKSDDEFLLTPLEEAGEEEESDSGSQVIALDSGPVSDTAATMVASGPAPMAPMLDEDLGAGVSPLGPAAPAAGPGSLPMGGDDMRLGTPSVPAAAEAPALPETPYSPLNVVALSACILLLVFCGWMTYDLMRNMWSWDGPYKVNSALMDWVLGLFGG